MSRMMTPAERERRREMRARATEAAAAIALLALCVAIFAVVRWAVAWAFWLLSAAVCA